MDIDATSGDDRVYVVKSTSNVSSVVEDIAISETPAGRARKVLRSEIIDNLRDASNSVKLTLVHQKRKSAGEPWEDEDGSTLQQTTPLTPSRFPLDSAETKALFDRLTDLYQIGESARWSRIDTLPDPSAA